MDKTELCFTPATELAGAIRAKKLSSVEITSTVLERIAALEPKLNAFAHLAAEEAMEAAAKADRAFAKGDSIGPLHGIPVTIKDHRSRAGHAGRIRHASAPRRRRNRRQRHGLAAAQGRRHHPRQDHHAGIRLDRRQPQPADRHYPQSVETRPQRRGVFRGRRRRRGGGLRSAASGQRRRGFDPHARAFLRRLRLEADLWTRAAIADRPERLHRASRPADAHRCGRGADAQGDGRPASRRSNEPRRRRRPIIPACWRAGRARRVSPSVRTLAMPASIPKSPRW